GGGLFLILYAYDGSTVEAFRFLNVFAGGIVAGGLFIILFAYTHALRSLPPASVAGLHALFHPRAHVSMMRLSIVGVVTAVILAVRDPGWDAETLLPLVGTLGGVATAILSRFWVVPMSDAIIAWKEGGPPGDAPRVLRSWTLLHAGRAAGGLFAFVCYLLAALL
ncbi:MAG: DUF1772 domain-containing protein, partial [Actinobacteria bacterium]|nr:DUF1772 domain-containing protein [Actinomycetota bacterium]